MSEAKTPENPEIDTVKVELATVLNDIQLLDEAQDLCKSIWSDIETLPEK